MTRCAPSGRAARDDRPARPSRSSWSRPRRRSRPPASPSCSSRMAARSSATRSAVPSARWPRRQRWRHRAWPGVVETGSTVIEGLGEVLYAATLIREPLSDRSVPTLMLVREDDSARLASGDLVRALAVAAVVLLLVGIPLAVGLGRSVSGPLRRLAFASGTVAAGRVPDALPISGSTRGRRGQRRLQRHGGRGGRHAPGPAPAPGRRPPRPAHTADRHRRVLRGAPRWHRHGRCRRTGRGGHLGRSRPAGAHAGRPRPPRDAGIGGPTPAPGVDRGAGPGPMATVERFAGEAEARGQSLALADGRRARRAGLAGG